MVSFSLAAQSRWLSFLLLLTTVLSATFFAHFSHLPALPGSYWQGHIAFFVRVIGRVGLLLSLLGSVAALQQLTRSRQGKQG